MAMVKRLDYLIVPCPGDPTFNGDRIKFSDLDKDNNLYLGAEDRMKAAVMEAKKAKNIILVGGSESKVTAMYIYFKKQMIKSVNKNISEPICLVSKPDSTGNFAAVKIYFERNEKNISKFKFAVISNDYHLFRLELIWNVLFDIRLKLISAEKILKVGTTDKIYKQELVRRKISEKAGYRDWKNGLYDDQEKIEPWNPKFWKCEELILNFETKKHEQCLK